MGWWKSALWLESSVQNTWDLLQSPNNFLNQSQVLRLEHSDSEKGNGTSEETGFLQLGWKTSLVRNRKVWVVKGMFCLSEHPQPCWSLLGLKRLFSAAVVCPAQLSSATALWLSSYSAKRVTPPARASGRVNKSQTQTTWRDSHPLSLPSSLAPFPLADNQLSGKCEGCLLTQMWRDVDELIWQKSALCLTSLSLYAAE